MRTLLFTLSLLLAPVATAQFLHGDIVVGHWYGSPEAVQHAPDGTIKQTFVGSSTGFMQGATVTRAGQLLVSRWEPAEGYSLFDPDGTEVTTIHTPEITDITGDTGQFANGNYIIVSQKSPRALVIYNESHQFVRLIGATAGMAHPFGVFVDADDHVWVSDIGSPPAVFEFSPQGALIRSFQIAKKPGDLVRAPDGTIWFIAYDTGRVYNYAIDGTLLSSFPTLAVQNSSPAIGMRADGTLVVGATHGVDLYVYDQAGNLLTSFPDGNPSGGPVFLSIVDLGGPIGTNYCGPANLNSSGSPAVIAAWGFEAVAFNGVRLDATQMAANKFGMFVNSQTLGFVTPPLSQGNLCLSGGIGRHSADILHTGASGEFSLQLDLTDVPTPSGSVAIQAGETWYWQAWFRDQNPGNTSNFTDGICITFS